MNKVWFTLGAVVLILIALFAGCGGKKEAEWPPVEPALNEPSVPEGYRKIAPTTIDGSRQMLAQTAAIITGRLKEVRFSFDNCSGPRTNYVFSDATTLLGAPVGSEVTLSIFGGPTPWGTWIRSSESPHLALDAQYVVFMRNTDWTYSPIVGSLIFRRETVGGREALINPAGRALIGWSEDGPVLSAAAVSESPGMKLAGYRASAPQANDNKSAPGEIDPKPEIRPSAGPSPVPTRDGKSGSTISTAPSLQEMLKSGMFAKPALLAESVANVPLISTESLLSNVRNDVERSGTPVGGRITLEPYWRCWSYTPTNRVAQ